jgi:hypothetical protein
MNPGIGEEGGKVATSLITNLHDSPLTLALVLFNMAFIFVIYLSVRDQRGAEEAFQNRLFDQQAKSMEMLYHCSPLPLPKIVPEG